ncbi:MAG: AAA domain-containing protein [Proteobacteria bacterium]|nr:AAA domain-containing protein [Pseudomonadota bacterium]
MNTNNDKNFFRDATLQICSSLDAETFLFNSFCYIRNFLPVDSAYLTRFDSSKRTQLCLASASIKGGKILNITVPVPEMGAKLMRQPDLSSMIVKRADEFAGSQPYIDLGLLKKEASMLSLRLSIGKEIIGAVIFTVNKSDQYQAIHAELLTELKEPFAIAFSNALKYKELHAIKELLVEDNRFLKSEIQLIAGDSIIGSDFGLKEVMRRVDQVATLPSPVLIMGETGTGKELLARVVHKLSGRREGPFITVNCGAIPENLIDSELFGHEKGAFTGAVARKQGRFERANKGTIFLDEIGELKLDAQVRLLRVLQERVIERVGGTESIKLDIRIIAATHRNLSEMADQNSFRRDLYFRLNVFPIEVPSLRERRGDIPLLTQHFIQKKSLAFGIKKFPELGSGAIEQLMAYRWTGNVRELENVIERAIIINQKGPLNFSELEPNSKSTGVINPIPVDDHKQKKSLLLDQIISQHIIEVLNAAGGKVGGENGAAEILGLNPSTLRKKMVKLNIPFGKKNKPLL